MASTPTQTRVHPAYDLKPGDVIDFDFRGSRLGECEVFDAYPIAGGREITGGLVQVVLIDKDGQYRYRQVTGSLEFAVR